MSNFARGWSTRSNRRTSPLGEGRPSYGPQLLSLCLAVFVAYIGAGMVSTVRVLYVQHQGGSLATISAMATAFFLANFAFQYPWGWIADRVDRQKIILIGLLWQAVVTAGYIVVSDPGLFILLRFLEGAGAASILPAARASIADMVPDAQRGRAYGRFTMFFNAGFLFGPALGGLLASVGFLWVFAISVVLRLAGAVIVARSGARSNHSGDAGATKRPERASWSSLCSVGLLAAYIVSFGDYLWLGFDQTVAPLWMRHHLGATLALIGIAYSVWALPSSLLAPLGGRLADRYPRWLLVLAAGLGQLPVYAVYISARSIYAAMAGFAVQACLYAVVSPAIDAHLAAASPMTARGRVQSMFTGSGLLGAFVGATAFTPLYALDFRLPLLVQGVGYGTVILIGSAMMWSWQSRQAANRYRDGVVEPHPSPPAPG